jgi:phage-related protein (TIGR01555 family)
MRSVLRPETVGKDQFKGLLVLDRWMIEPELSDLVTDFGPDLGKPKYYRIGANAPALRGQVVHYSRVAFRLLGVALPYQQSLNENMWGISVIERLYDRMIAYDSASTGAAQLIYKSYLRTLKIKGMREIVASGGAMLNGLVKYTEMMRRFQGIEGITLIDGEDEFEAQAHGAFSGISDVMNQFSQQLSGALQIPLTRLFGQSPGGLNASGDNEMRNYYDHIKQRQEADLLNGVTIVYRLQAQSDGIKLPDNFGLTFRSLWQLTESDKATIAKTNTETIMMGSDAALVSPQVALQELRQQSRVTGIWSNITTDLIDAADEEPQPPQPEMFDPTTGAPSKTAQALQGTLPHQTGSGGMKNGKPAGSQKAPGKLAAGKTGGKAVQPKSAVSS